MPMCNPSGYAGRSEAEAGESLNPWKLQLQLAWHTLEKDRDAVSNKEGKDFHPGLLSPTTPYTGTKVSFFVYF